jgi:hypothetical protein
MPCTSRCETCEHVMARQAPAGLLGIHVNMPAAVPADSAQKAASTSGDVFQYMEVNVTAVVEELDETL